MGGSKGEGCVCRRKGCVCVTGSCVCVHVWRACELAGEVVWEDVHMWVGGCVCGGCMYVCYRVCEGIGGGCVSGKMCMWGEAVS